MNDALRKTLDELPEKPGCYIMRDRAGRIIYVGKAVSLRRRVQSYFRESTMRKGAPKLRSLVHSVHSLEFMVVRNEAEALLTESKLIKEHKPRYNVLLRDDHRYMALRAEHTLAVPRLSLCRIVREDDGDEYFGPFPSSGVVRKVKDFLEKRFGIRKCSAQNPDEEAARHCLNDVLARCAAPCIGKCTPDEYRERFDKACNVLRGIGEAAIEGELREEMAQASEERNFEKAALIRDTIFALRDMIRRRARAKNTPQLDKELAEGGVADLARHIGITEPPRLIEGFDISHIGGTLTVASMVAAVDGRPAKSRYRRFRIRTVIGADDPRSMAEVISRRYSRALEEGQELPGLIMVDGGITQLRAARAELARLGLQNVPTVGLAKRREEIVVDRPDEESILLPLDSQALQVLTRLRDEAHRFAISYNRQLREKKIRESILDEIEGIGPSRKALLLKTFGSVHKLAEAKPESIAIVGGIGMELARQILAKLSPSTTQSTSRVTGDTLL